MRPRATRVQSVLRHPGPRPKLYPADLQRLTELLGPGNYGVLARKSGYDRSHVRKVLSGKVNCTLDFACVIADFAGVSLDDFRSYIVSHKLKRSETQTAFRRALMGLPMNGDAS